MTEFDGYLAALECVDPVVGYEPVDDYFYAHQDDAARLASILNARLQLGERSAHKFQPDLPLIGCGSHRGVVVLSANPGYRDPADDPRNQAEDVFRRSSLDAAKSFTRDFFAVHPQVLASANGKPRWLSFYTGHIELLALLGWERVTGAAGLPAGDRPALPADRRLVAHASRLLGGWELIPWHSSQDGFRSGLIGVGADPLLTTLAHASLRAALRCRPEVLVVASAAGYELLRGFIHDGWSEGELVTRRSKVKLARTVTAHTEIVAVRWQMFSRYSPVRAPAVVAQVQALRTTPSA